MEAPGEFDTNATLLKRCSLKNISLEKKKKV